MYRKLESQYSAGIRIALYLHRSPHQQSTFANAYQAKPAFPSRYALRILRKSFAVITDHQRDSLACLLNTNFSFGCARMLQDVVCCFLDDPVDVDALGFRKALINVFDTGLESDLGCSSDRPYQGFDCLRQAEAIQLKGPQIVGNSSSFLDRLRDFTAHFIESLLLFVATQAGRFGPPKKIRQILDHDQPLSKAVV